MHRRLLQPIVFVPVLIVLAIVGVWWFAFRADDNATASSSSTTKQVVDVTTGPMSQTVSAEGTVAAAQTDDLSFSSAGTVTAVNVKAGDAVKAGQVLATIDSAELASAVASAQADVADAQAKLSDDQSSGASDAQVTADESSVESANDALTNANEALAGASLVATFDGVVASVNLTAGQQLTSSGTGASSPTGSASGSGASSDNLGSGSSNPTAQGSGSDTSSTAQIQVVSSGRFTVELAVDSADIASVKVGQTATLTKSTSSSSRGAFPGAGRFLFGAGQTTQGSGQSPNNGSRNAASGATSGTGTEATGLVASVGKIADASSGVATYPVTIVFDASPTDFYVGSTVTGAVATNTRQNVVQVSSFAVTNTNGVSTVTVATDGTATGPTQTRTVTTGLVANGRTEITSGLKAGEKVVISITRPTGAGGTGGTGGFTPPAGGTGNEGFQGGPPGGFTGAGG
jgi:multidrug efflux pump subunit AcrA (membrane-fusion protein)